MDNASAIVVALAILLVGGYAVGAVINARRMGSLIAGLRDALAGPGGAPTVRRLRRTIVRLEADRPVRGTGPVVATVLMAPREAVLVWALWALRGRGDLLDVKAHLDAVPSGAGLVADPRHRIGHAAIDAGLAAGGTRGGLPGTRLATVTYDQPGATAMARMARVAEGVGDIVLVELRAAQPRLTVLVSLHGAPRSLSGLRSALQHVVDAASADE